MLGELILHQVLRITNGEDFIFEISKSKKWHVKKALDINAWIKKIVLSEDLSINYVSQFIDLWVCLSGVHLNIDEHDEIAWRLTTSGQYMEASAYKAQFLGSTSTDMDRVIWKIWAPTEINIFFCLACHSN